MDWLQITVHTTTEGSDIVSQVLMDAGSNGTSIEDRNDIQLNQRPEGQWDILPESLAENMSEDVLVTGYFEADARAQDALSHIRDRLRVLNEMDLDMDLGKLTVETSGLGDQDWAEYWKKQYKPFKVGSHMVIRPSWTEYQPADGEKVIEIDPGLAFGTGTHETTNLCVTLVEKYVKPGMKVIDVGTGSGILAIAAAHMGAASVLATDIDEMAVKVARENAEKNGFAQKIECRQGDLLKAVDERGEVVIANIIADVIIQFAEPVKKHVTPGGAFICSGIVAEREGDVRAALEQAGYQDIEVLHQGEWVAMACSRPER